MADLVEYVHQGRDNLVDWQLREGGAALTAGEITRAVLTLTEQTSGQVVTLDTDEAEVSLGAAGHVRWSVPVLSLALGDLVPATLPLGTYAVQLVTYDVDNPDGVRWARTQSVALIVEGG